jgi:hypothetical protein
MFSDDLIQNHLRVLDCVNFEINTTSLIEKRDYKKFKRKIVIVSTSNSEIIFVLEKTQKSLFKYIISY